MIGRWLHVNDRSDQLAWQTLAQVRALGNVAGVKVVNPDADTLAKLRNEYGAKVLIARLDVPGLTLEQGGRGWYEATANKVAALASRCDYIEVPVNEQYPAASEIGRFADASAEYVRLAAGVGARCIVGNFSVGTPEPWDAAAFVPALQAALQYDGALGLHEYGLPGNFGAGYWIGRWTEFYTAAAVKAEEVWELPCILTEFGIDGGLETPPRPRDTAGWRAYGMTAQQYATWLDGALAIEQEYADDCGLSLLGVCLFNCGDYADKKWHSFEVGGEPALAQWLAASEEVQTPVSQPPTNGGNVAHVTEGVPDFGALRPWPWQWDQLNDATIDGRPDEGRLNNCGPQSLAEAVYYITAERIMFAADEIHDQLMAEGASRYTTVAELAKWCDWHGIPSEPLSGDAQTLLQPKVRWAIDNGKPIIVLFAFDLDKLTGGHFCPVYAYDTGGCWRANPWGGKSEYMTWPEFERAQLFGQALILHATRS